MRIAVIDLGTNTFNVVIADCSGKQFKILFSDKYAVKLGEGGINNHIIQTIPYQRGIDAIKMILDIIKPYRVDKVEAFATSAIRSAVNGKDFVAEIKNKFNLEVDIIKGLKEAEYIYFGVKAALDFPINEKVLIMDIGGGSTEFIIADNETMYWKHSYDLGIARLLDNFNPDDPISKKQILQINNYLKEKLATLIDAILKYKVTELIGSSGSFDTFADLICNRFHTPELLQEKTTYLFDLNELQQIHEKLLKSNKEDRLNMKGMSALRSDMIVIASIFTQYIITTFNIKTVRLSTYSLKEGVLYHHTLHHEINTEI